jgi:flagellar biosynthesis protein FlhG
LHLEERLVTENSPVTISVASGKGGVGKTCITINLAASLSEKGKRVLVIDCDLGLANIDIMLGINPRSNLKDVIFGDIDVRDVLIRTEAGFDFLPASSGVREMTQLLHENIEKLKDIITQISHGYDYVFLDIGAGISDTVLQFNLFAARNFVIVSKDLTSITDAYAMMKTIHRTSGKKSFEIIVNSVSDDDEGLRVFNHIDSICKRFLDFSPRHLGSIPFDEVVTRSIMKQTALVRLFPESAAAVKINQIAHAICP